MRGSRHGSISVVVAIARWVHRTLDDFAIVRVDKKVATHASLRGIGCLLDIAGKLLARLGDFRGLLCMGAAGGQYRKGDQMTARKAAGSFGHRLFTCRHVD